ncbi:hypothetical protein O5O45_07060 [Hahella aquimaris]|uniref:hypothetical protein n=1 Tax=Hahella sp. HNIBRBA332 TaxID=3015983 RepID=UPI00273C9716|nr:hypothetical protein [Hahella sp. HNIBRBA332]WLQ15673.1 hypothetical protein O5O45_07060 [Hahella sp. HNIBRBA332]
MVTDINGKEVIVGSRVKVLEIDMSVTEGLSENEVIDIKSMLDDVLEVYEVDEYGRAWVEKWWDRGDGRSESHSLALESKQMEVV